MGEIEQNIQQYKRLLDIEVKKLEGVKKKIRKMENDKVAIQNKINGLNDFIAGHNNDLNISEHAIVRYFERVLGYDLEKLKNSIITEELIKNHSIVGNGNYQFGKNTLVIKNKTIITII